jgi:hypothetical protein
MKFKVICCIILVLIQLQCEGFLFGKLRQKLRAFRKGMTKKQTAEVPLKLRLEYPGNDPQLRQEIQQLWEKYYACLQRKYESLGPQKTVMPEAIMVFEGTSVR